MFIPWPWEMATPVSEISQTRFCFFGFFWRSPPSTPSFPPLRPWHRPHLSSFRAGTPFCRIWFSSHLPKPTCQCLAKLGIRWLLMLSTSVICYLYYSEFSFLKSWVFLFFFAVHFVKPMSSAILFWRLSCYLVAYTSGVLFWALMCSPVFPMGIWKSIT